LRRRPRPRSKWRLGPHLSGQSRHHLDHRQLFTNRADARRSHILSVARPSKGAIFSPRPPSNHQIFSRTGGKRRSTPAAPPPLRSHQPQGQPRSHLVDDDTKGPGRLIPKRAAVRVSPAAQQPGAATANNPRADQAPAYSPRADQSPLMSKPFASTVERMTSRSPGRCRSAASTRSRSTPVKGRRLSTSFP
jgi:hypothetical protein